MRLAGEFQLVDPDCCGNNFSGFFGESLRVPWPEFRDHSSDLSVGVDQDSEGDAFESVLPGRSLFLVEGDDEVC